MTWWKTLRRGGFNVIRTQTRFMNKGEFLWIIAIYLHQIISHRKVNNNQCIVYSTMLLEKWVVLQGGGLLYEQNIRSSPRCNVRCQHIPCRTEYI